MLQLNWTGRHCYRRPVSIRQQHHSHRRSDADLELDFNGAAALSDKSLNLAETETRTSPNRLRREIGVEGLPKHACRSRNRRFRRDDALENDLATPVREITSRHGVDKRSLLPLAAQRGAVARNATSRRHSKLTLLFCETSKPRSVAKSAINAVAAWTTGAEKFAQ